jgi:hypothetical protein
MVARRREDSAPIRSMRVGVDRTQVQRFDAGRVCEALGCVTVLSVYNASPFCWQHERPRRSVVGPVGRRSSVRPPVKVRDGVWERSGSL